MTKQMLDDLVKDLNKKVKRLSIALVVFIVLFVGMTAFAFSEFDIVCEEDTKYEYDISQDANTNGDNSEINQEQKVELPTKNNDTLIICISVVVCLAIITTGVILYGKAKNKANYKKEEEAYDKEEKHP